MKFYVLTALLVSGFAHAASNSQKDAQLKKNEPVQTSKALVDLAKLDNALLPSAPPELVEELATDCRHWVKKDMLSDVAVAKSVLECVNLELDITGYKMVKKI